MHRAEHLCFALPFPYGLYLLLDWGFDIIRIIILGCVLSRYRYDTIESLRTLSTKRNQYMSKNETRTADLLKHALQLFSSSPLLASCAGGPNAHITRFYLPTSSRSWFWQLMGRLPFSAGSSLHNYQIWLPEERYEILRWGWEVVCQIENMGLVWSLKWLL